MNLNRSRRGGCLAQLAVGLLVVVVVAALIMGVLAFLVRKNINKYTTKEEPPPPTFTAEDASAQYEQLKPRIEQLFKEREQAAGDPEVASAGAGESQPSSDPSASGDGEDPLTIRLSPADLNALAYRAMGDLPDNAHVTFSIAGERLILNTSIPLKGVPLLGGRYFVGTIELSEPPAGYPLPLYLQTVTASGEALPNGLISRFQEPDNARGFLTSNGLGGELRHVRSIRIEGGELVVTLNPEP